MKTYPVKFKPIHKERIWGGSALAEKYKKPFPPGLKIGESWEISDRQDSMSIVENGEYEGMSLTELVDRFKDDFLGNIAAVKFPVLVKVIDARDVLSVQVHPDDAFAKKNENGSSGKTEMWYVIETDPGAKITAALRKKTSREEFRKALEGKKLPGLLNTFPVKPGDVIFIPSGRVHAIGAGIVLLEIQQNADVTYRVYDWDRVGFDGKPRELHVEKALKVIDFNDSKDPVVPVKEQVLGNNSKRPMVSCKYFSNDAYRISDEMRLKTKGSFNIVSCVEGEFEVEAGNVVERLSKGYSCVIPASASDYSLKNIGKDFSTAVVTIGKK
ncbi:MAG: class I mannose-6-phosphate isomerase [Candidatus Aureabacteria bacterium]|nr:class I mannose-6-phosphate isomerase [Candidatus Auribacterota bacterium]